MMIILHELSVKMIEQAHEQAFTEKPATFMARIQLEYEMQR